MPGASPPLVMTPIRFTTTDYDSGSGTIGFKERTLRTKLTQIGILSVIGIPIGLGWWRLALFCGAPDGVAHAICSLLTLPSLALLFLVVEKFGSKA